MTREGLIVIGKKIMSEALNAEEYYALEELFEKNVPHPTPMDLFYNKKFEGLIEEIVDRCLSYKPIQL